MSSLLNLYRKILNSTLSLVKQNPIPHNPVEELNLEINKPFIYVLPYTSQTDLLILRKNCLAVGLPDPLMENDINGNKLARFAFLDEGRRIFRSNGVKKETENLFKNYLELHRTLPDLDVQVIPASVLWGRSPGLENKSNLPDLRLVSGIKKAISTLWFRRDIFVRFSKAMSLRELLRDTKQNDERLAQKLARVARIHFSKQRLSATGPRLPNRAAMFNKLLNSDAILAAIEDEAKAKKITTEKATAEARKILNEIAADVSYNNLRMLDRFLSWLWNKLYQGIDVKHADRVRQLALEGHEIVYVPCHRSHIDYLLLSYVLYHQGLFPPHIAAGVNLNFWPAGSIFRHSGAFFIRRTFKGNRLYSTIFREYLAELFHRGYSVEYFIEGGRSRTGRLLAPKTGMMSMTIQALKQGQTRPISIVPVYIGYEHVLEVDTYAKELRGAAKEKENAGLVLRVLKKLRNLGKGYVNFAEPITLNSYLNQHFPEWKKTVEERPQWFSPAVDQISHQVMVNINNAAAVNAMNLTGTALLSSRQRALSREQMLEQLNSYQKFLQNVPYSADIIVPNESPAEMLEHVLNLDRVGVLIEKDNFGEIVRLERNSAVLMTYYRNNIQHLFVLPSLISSIVLHYEAIQKDLVLDAVQKIYPFLQSELFLHFHQEELPAQIENIIAELQRQALIKSSENLLSINKARVRSLQLWAAGVREILQRYYITLSLLRNDPNISRATLEKESQSVAQRLSVLHGINAPEFFDKAVFSGFVASLKENDYFDENNAAVKDKIKDIASILNQIISAEVNLTIQSAVEKTEDNE